MAKGAGTAPPDAIIGFPPVILCFAHNVSHQSLGMVYYLHKEQEHYRGLRIHCTDRRCRGNNDALESFEQVHSRLTLENPHILVLVEENIAASTLSRITAAVGDNVKQLPLKAFELRDSELLGEFTKPPRDWDVGQPAEWKETPEKKYFIQFGNERPDIARTALALVKYLRTRYTEIATLLKLDTRENGCKIDFQFSSLDNVVCIDRNTLYALNIFQTDDHPSTVRPHGRGKEGFSLNSFLECFVVSAGGRKLLREWCLQPTRDLGELRMRQQSVHALLTSNLREMATATRQTIASWKSPVSLWASLSLNVNFDNLADWKKFMHEQELLVEILSKFEKLDQKGLSCVQGIGKAREPLKKSLIFMEMLLDLSELEHIDDSLVRLKSEVDPLLAKSRETYSHVSRYLNGMGILDKNYDFESRGHFLPSYGFCVSLGPNDEPPIDFALKFHLNGRIFYKTKYCTVIDARLGGVYLEIRTREIQLLKAMVQHLRPVYDFWLEIVAQVFDQFDVLTGFALCSAQYNWTRPIFVEKPLSHIEDGTHPLVEHILDTDLSKEGIQRTFVPNDTFLGGKQPPIQVITGANCSGKSVYLKQVGLVHFLAHIGSFVPAKESHIGVADMIFSRIRTLESASVQLSAFEIDVAQMSRMLQSATENSLILVDEFGKGTRPDDGAALLAACIMRLADRVPLPPRCIFTTHYPEIFTLNLVKHPLVQSFYMDTEKSGKNCTGAKAMEYLYKLRPGFCTRSYGIECAQLAGIPNNILYRALDIYKHLESGDGIPTFEVQALRLLRGFDWERGDRMDLIKQVRNTLQGKLVMAVEGEPDTTADGAPDATVDGARDAPVDGKPETAVTCTAAQPAIAEGHTEYGTPRDIRDPPCPQDLSRRQDSRDSHVLLSSADLMTRRASAAAPYLPRDMLQKHPELQHVEGVQGTAKMMTEWDERHVRGVTTATESIMERTNRRAQQCDDAWESPQRHYETAREAQGMRGQPEDAETPPEYRSGLDKRGGTMHCSVAAAGPPHGVMQRNHQTCVHQATEGLPTPSRVRSGGNMGSLCDEDDPLWESVEKHYEVIPNPLRRVDEDINVLVDYCDTQNDVKQRAPCDIVRDSDTRYLRDHTLRDYEHAEPHPHTTLYDPGDAREQPITRDCRHVRPYYQTVRHPGNTQPQHTLEDYRNRRPHYHTLPESGSIQHQFTLCDSGHVDSHHQTRRDSRHMQPHDQTRRDSGSMEKQPPQRDSRNMRPHDQTRRDSESMENQPSQRDSRHTHLHYQTRRDSENMEHQPWQGNSRNTHPHATQSDSPDSRQRRPSDDLDHANHRLRVRNPRNVEPHHYRAEDSRARECTNARPTAHHRRADNDSRLRRHAPERPRGQSGDRYPRADIVPDGHVRHKSIPCRSPVIDAHSPINSRPRFEVTAYRRRGSNDRHKGHAYRHRREVPKRSGARENSAAKRRCYSTSPRKTRLACEQKEK